MKKILIIVAAFSLLVLFNSCYEKLVSNPVGNQPPNTYLFLFPDSTISSQPSRLKVFWSGDDPDGFVIGFYFSWDSVSWTFTEKNDSLFALQIGVVDTNYVFLASAVDNSGDGLYNSQVVQNGVNYGPEPFTDLNGNGQYDPGEPFIDIGLIDPSPARLFFPIKNTAPVVVWNALSFLPDTSFSAMTFGWEASDLDGDETIQAIHIALNDTSNFISLDGSVRRITIRTKDFSSSAPLMDVLIDGNPGNIVSVKLPGLKFNDNNIFYVQAVDVSGAKSPFLSLPGTDATWYVKKPKGKLVIIDNYSIADDANDFYAAMMDSLGLNDKYDFYDIQTETPPYLSITFLETIKLFNYALWYTDPNPALDLASATVSKYLDAGGKIFFSMQFPASVDLTVVQGFLPILADSSSTRASILAGVKVVSDTTDSSYPNLETSISIFRPRSFYLGSIGVTPIYYFPNNELKGFIGFANSEKSIFYLGLPLNKVNAGNYNVKALLSKVLFQDFGLTL